jgi:hypothetical protein
MVDVTVVDALSMAVTSTVTPLDSVEYTVTTPEAAEVVNTVDILVVIAVAVLVRVVKAHSEIRVVVAVFVAVVNATQVPGVV